MKHSQRGQAAVEFALILPLLLILVVGVIEFGRAWNQHMVITDGAREAARKAAIHDESVTEDDVIDRAEAALARAGIDPSTATITAVGWDGEPNDDVTVTIDLPYQFTFFGPLINWTTGQSNIVLKTSITMRNE